MTIGFVFVFVFYLFRLSRILGDLVVSTRDVFAVCFSNDRSGWRGEESASTHLARVLCSVWTSLIFKPRERKHACGHRRAFFVYPFASAALVPAAPCYS